jgi:putative ABC transport system permease protein
MIRFLAKGLVRDRSRSLFPLLAIIITVTLVIFGIGFMEGAMNNFLQSTAVISSGHVKVVTKAYKKESNQLPNDLALFDTKNIIQTLSDMYPDYFWTPRITFGGLLDVPDKNGETKEQAPVFALGIDFFSEKSRQVEIWELEKCLISGRLPKDRDDALVSTKLAKQLGIGSGSSITLIGSTMDNAFTTYNFNVVGTFNLYKGQTDRQMMLVDISGARQALDMEDAASEILGYHNSLYYHDEEAVTIRKHFNITYSDSIAQILRNEESKDILSYMNGWNEINTIEKSKLPQQRSNALFDNQMYDNSEEWGELSVEDPSIYTPTMVALRDDSQLATMVDFSNVALGVMAGIFLVIVMIVLWNMGLMNGLRRYGEIGLRLAIGESKGQVYRSMINEAVLIGFVGTLIGTIFGISLTYYVQEFGIDYSEAINQLSTTMVMPNVFYAKVTPELYYIGFIPGVLATVLGTMLAGLAIYKREMSQLFKELET